MNSLLAVFPPLLAIATLMYLLKQLKLGNLFSPKAALSMATAGVGKMAGEEKMASRLIAAPGELKNAGIKTGQTGLKAWRSPRGQGVRSVVRQGAGGMKELVNTLSDPKAALETLKSGASAAKEALTTKEGALKAGALGAAGTASVLAKLGVWAAGEDSKVGQVLKPLTMARDNTENALEARSQRHALEAAQRDARDAEEMASIRAGHDTDRLLSLGATNRELPPGTGYEMLTEDFALEKAEELAALHGGTPDQWLVDKATGAIMPGTGASLVPDMGSEEKTWEVAKHPALYFSNNKMLEGESIDDYTLRMTATGLVTGHLSAATGEWSNALEEFNIPDTAEGRVQVLASANPGKEPAITQRISLTAEEEARVQSMMETMRQTTPIAATPAALAAKVIVEDVTPDVNRAASALKTAGAELLTAANYDSSVSRASGVHDVMGQLDAIRAAAADAAGQIAATRAKGSGADDVAVRAAVEAAAWRVEGEVSEVASKVVNVALSNDSSVDATAIQAELNRLADKLTADLEQASSEVTTHAEIERAAKAKAERVKQVSSRALSGGRRPPAVK